MNENFLRQKLSILALLGLLLPGLLALPAHAAKGETQNGDGSASETEEDKTSSSDDEFPDWEDDEIALGYIVSDSSPEPGRVETFTITLDSSSTLRIETHGFTDTLGVLFDERGRELAAADHGGVGGNFQMIVDLPAGRYLLGITRARGSVGPYGLEVALMNH